MATTISVTPPIAEPDTLTAGDTWAWTRLLQNYDPSSGWVLSYVLVSNAAGTTPIKITGTDNGDGQHKIEVDAATTAVYVAGFYTWQAYVTNATTTERYKIFDGQLTIEPNFAAVAANTQLDARSQVKQVLDALEALILGKALNGDQLHYTINGRSLNRMSPRDVVYWRNYYRGLYTQELRIQRTKRGLSSSGKVRARFNSLTYPLNGSEWPNWPRGTE